MSTSRPRPCSATSSTTFGSGGSSHDRHRVPLTGARRRGVQRFFLALGLGPSVPAIRVRSATLEPALRDCATTYFAPRRARRLRGRVTLPRRQCAAFSARVAAARDLPLRLGTRQRTTLGAGVVVPPPGAEAAP